MIKEAPRLGLLIAISACLPHHFQQQGFASGKFSVNVQVPLVYRRQLRLISIT